MNKDYKWANTLFTTYNSSSFTSVTAYAKLKNGNEFYNLNSVAIGYNVNNYNNYKIIGTCLKFRV